MKKRINLIFCLFAIPLFAQTYKGELTKVSKSGLNSITLLPEVRSAMNNNVSFFRIIDGNKNEVPYIVFDENKVETNVQNFKIISKNAIPNELTSIVISNENAINFDNISLKIANTAVEKKYNISGSNDEKQWFGLVSNEVISNLNDSGTTTVNRNFSFPLNNYKFIKFDFIDKKSLPINVLESFVEKSKFVTSSEIELVNFDQKIVNDKENKKTIIEVKFKNAQVIDRLNFEIISPNLYLRKTNIVVHKSRVFRNKTENYTDEIASFELNSKTKNQFEISNFFEKEFTIEIDNQDNLPLEIKALHFYQKPLKLIADLKQNESYEVVVDSTFKAPNYDLENFQSSFNNDLPKLSIQNFEKINNNKSVISQEPFWQKPIFMWVCIVLAVVVIGYFALGLLKDMNKE